MGWGFRATCPDCRHEWQDVDTSYRFGPGSMLLLPDAEQNFQRSFCPRCYHRLSLPRAMERNAWRKWYATFLAGPDAKYEFLREVAAKIDIALSQGPDYAPLPINVGSLDCPGCHQPFEESSPDTPDRIDCPNCGQRNTLLDGYESHCQMFVTNGFS